MHSRHAVLVFPGQFPRNTRQHWTNQNINRQLVWGCISLCVVSVLPFLLWFLMPNKLRPRLKMPEPSQIAGDKSAWWYLLELSECGTVSRTSNVRHSHTSTDFRENCGVGKVTQVHHCCGTGAWAGGISPPRVKNTRRCWRKHRDITAGGSGVVLRGGKDTE